MNYYNEFDKHAAQWLRNLITGGMIPAGNVDERSIEDVRPDDLRGYTQCHFFAGIGGWSEALRLAGWPADRPVWTGSCPCQPFSVAGKGNGANDKRHLWPVWYTLIKECRPPVIFSEQVEAAINHGWLDLVQNDMERESYAFGAVGLPACSVGAPHIRKRLWFMAYCNGERLEKRKGIREFQQEALAAPEGQANFYCGNLGRMGNAACSGVWGDTGNVPSKILEKSGQRKEYFNGQSPGDVNQWSRSEWIYCRDEKFRPIEPGTLPLVDGVSKRMVKIRGYGNAIVPQVAAEIIRTGMEYIEEVGV